MYEGVQVSVPTETEIPATFVSPRSVTGQERTSDQRSAASPDRVNRDESTGGADRTWGELNVRMPTPRHNAATTKKNVLCPPASTARARTKNRIRYPNPPAPP